MSEIDIEAAKWVIPAKRMKMKAEHFVPISTQAVTLLKGLYQLSGSSYYVFQGARSNKRPLGDNGPKLLFGLRAVDEMTPSKCLLSEMPRLR